MVISLVSWLYMPIEFAIALQYAESMLDTVGNAKFTHCLNVGIGATLS